MIKIYSRILLATDGSPHAKNAAKKAVKLQQILNCKVVIIHSIKDNRVPSELYSNIKSLYAKYETLEQIYIDAGEKLLASIKRMFGDLSLIETRLIEKETAEDYIKHIVDEEDFDLVILGSQGHHSKLKKVLGTVSIKVSKNASCDVLIVK